MLASVTQILPITNIRRTRMLPVPGQVKVRQGLKVIATDVVAETEIPAGHISLDVRRGLGLQTTAEATRAVTRQVGENLEADDIIAEVHGMFSRILRAPVKGKIVFIGGGRVLMQTRTTKVEVIAGMNGTVVEVLPEYGAVIEENGALVQCAWGNGKIDSGVLRVVCETPDDVLTSQKIDVAMRGAVIFGGHCESPDVLRAGSEVQLRGLILGSMPSALVPQAEKVDYPIVVIEGFGKIPLSEAAFKLLSTNEKRDASINAVFAPTTGERPEILIPLNAEGQPVAPVAYFAAGQYVRIVGAPYTGKTGKIVQLRQGTVALPNGVRAPAADVQIDGEKRVWIPLANLEVLESSESSRRSIV